MVAAKPLRGRQALCFTLVLLSVFVSSSGYAQTVAGFTPGSFKVNESGAATYTIPIQVPPGVAGMEPKLAFTYNSNGRSGLLGMGWGLSGLSAITRCPRTIVQDGARGGVNFQDGTSGVVNAITSDRFCLDGKRLVMISASPTSYGADGAEYRTERETFSKIISYNNGTSGNGPTSFKVWTKAGQILEYGNTGDSRIEAQNKTSVRIWALNKISDKKGNYLTITYAEDNANGDFRPTRIDYDYGGTPSTPNASVQFIPDPLGRTDISLGFVAGSVVKTLTRLGYVRTYVGASLVKEYRLAYDNQGPVGSSRIIGISECDAGGACYTPTSVSWERNGDGALEYGGQWITTATLGGVAAGYGYNWIGDFNGDGKTDIASGSGTTLYLYLGNDNGSLTALPSITVPAFGSASGGYGYNWIGDFNGDGKVDLASGSSTNLYLYLGGVNGFSVAPTTTGVTFGGVVSGYGYNWIGDFNGDGKTDLASGSGTNLYLYLGGDNGFSVASTTTGVNFGGVVSGYGYNWIGDFNGDGKMDLASGSGTNLYLYLGGVNGFSVAPTTTGVTFGGVVSGYGYNWIGDFNGDGKADIASGSGNTLYLYLGSENGFTAARPTTVPALGGVVQGYGYNFVGDFNGDGKTDIASFSGTTLYLYLGNGDGFTVANTTTVPAYGGVVQGYGYNWTGDFNGDGKTDIAVFSGTTLYLYLGNGNGFTVATTTAVPSPFGGVLSGYGYTWTGDFNGDGKTDIATASGSTVYVYQGGPVRRFPDHLTGITNSLGAVTEIFYKPLTDNSIYTKFNPSSVHQPLGLETLQYSGSSYPIVDLQFPLYVVSNTTEGVAQSHVTNYTYYGLKAHQQGGGLLGFAYIQAEDVQNHITTSTAFRQDYPFRGLTSGVAKVALGPTLVTLDKVLNTWTTNPAVNALPYTFLTGKYHRCDLTFSVESGNDLNGAVLPTVSTTSSYDAYGNASSVTVSTGDGFSKTTNNIYFDPDTANWILGRIKESTITSVTP